MSEQIKKEGSLSINSENIFPIIKKWLYSDHDIFIREIISNGVDAITKLNTVILSGDFGRDEDFKDRIDVIVDDKEHTISFLDTGIGMTAEEVEKYINEIAFSGAAAFLEEYKDKAGDDQIIGHFGLGFYSAFMVADRVTIDTLSYKNGAIPVHWECDGGTDYSMTEGNKNSVGTLITLYINDDGKEFLDRNRVRDVILKYCSFMPVEIYLHTADEWNKYLNEDADEDSAEDAESCNSDDDDPDICDVEPENELENSKKEKRAPVSLSDTEPLWTKRPADCSDDEYKSFYHKVFHDLKDPLFWIHLNMDYPFNLKGILFFPKIGNEYDALEGTIKLYNNRVFIADNIKEVIPEFLMLLKGVIDCPDLPLNVSRSALQNDGFVRKVSDYITKKVADRLRDMCGNENDKYQTYWDDISPFVKFGCLKDDKFYDKMKESILFKDINDKYHLLSDMLVAENKTYTYVTDKVAQGQYVMMYKDAGMEALIMDSTLDAPFITMLEQKNKGLEFKRIDADIDGALKDSQEGDGEEISKEDADRLTEIFRKCLSDPQLDVSVQRLKDTGISGIITESEQMRRTQELMRMYGLQAAGMNEIEIKKTFIVNAANPLVKYVLENGEGENTELICRHIYDLARISHAPLTTEDMSRFIYRSNEILQMIAK